MSVRVQRPGAVAVSRERALAGEDGWSDEDRSRGDTEVPPSSQVATAAATARPVQAAPCSTSRPRTRRSQ